MLQQQTEPTKLFFVAMRHAVTLDMLAGGHILATSAAEAKEIAKPIFTDVAGIPEEMASRLRIKMGSGVVFGAHASSANRSNALNRVAA